MMRVPSTGNTNLNLWKKWGIRNRFLFGCRDFRQLVHFAIARPQAFAPLRPVVRQMVAGLAAQEVEIYLES